MGAVLLGVSRTIADLAGAGLPFGRTTAEIQHFFKILWDDCESNFYLPG